MGRVPGSRRPAPRPSGRPKPRVRTRDRAPSRRGPARAAPRSACRRAPPRGDATRARSHEPRAGGRREKTGRAALDRARSRRAPDGDADRSCNLDGRRTPVLTQVGLDCVGRRGRPDTTPAVGLGLGDWRAASRDTVKRKEPETLWECPALFRTIIPICLGSSSFQFPIAPLWRADPLPSETGGATGSTLLRDGCVTSASKAPTDAHCRPHPSNPSDTTSVDTSLRRSARRMRDRCRRDVVRVLLVTHKRALSLPARSTRSRSTGSRASRTKGDSPAHEPA